MSPWFWVRVLGCSLVLTAGIFGGQYGACGFTLWQNMTALPYGLCYAPKTENGETTDGQWLCHEPHLSKLKNATAKTFDNAYFSRRTPDDIVRFAHKTEISMRLSDMKCRSLIETCPGGQ